MRYFRVVLNTMGVEVNRTHVFKQTYYDKTYVFIRMLRKFQIIINGS